MPLSGSAAEPAKIMGWPIKAARFTPAFTMKSTRSARAGDRPNIAIKHMETEPSRLITLAPYYAQAGLDRALLSRRQLSHRSHWSMVALQAQTDARSGHVVCQAAVCYISVNIPSI